MMEGNRPQTGRTPALAARVLDRALFVALTVVFGAFAGAFCWGFFFLMNAGISLLWETVPAALTAAGLPAVAYPLAFCAVGGVCIGLFQKKVGP